jgi:chemotaxis protein histidine kinase CheA
MNKKIVLSIAGIFVASAIVFPPAWAKSKGRKSGPAAAPAASLTAEGSRLEAQYTAMLTALKAEIVKALPVVNPQKKAALLNAVAARKKADTEAQDAKEPLDEIAKQKGILANNQKFWVKNAQSQIAKAQADLKAATTDVARAAAQKTITEQQKRRDAGIVACKEREEAIKNLQLKASGANAAGSSVTAKAASDKAHDNEMAAAKVLLADLTPFLGSDKLDAKLVKCTMLTEATPNGLAAFAQQGPEQAAVVGKLLADDKLMKEMLVDGGANYGKYGRAMEIYTAILKASPKASEGVLHRLALAVSLEHATPVKQSNPEDQTDAPATVDPVKRYLSYEKAYLAGELDPAFKTLTAWEMRMVVNSDAPDQILAWGREMLRTYRPDHIYNPNYGWRYSATVKTEVPYGSQNVKYDKPSLQSYQNIIKDGGVCGRRAFFGRFILRCFGIPSWGVTQHAHAALSHWTPKGWVINLGAGFQASWWDKGDVSMSGSDFLLETQARAHAADYLKVLRAQWVSRILGEEAYNGRRGVDGGLWSSLGHYQEEMLAAKAVTLGPLGQDLAEANESPEKQDQDTVQASVEASDRQIAASKNGSVIIPAVASGQSAGKSGKSGCLTMKSFSGGLQIHCKGGFKTQYTFDAPQAGKYALSVRVATAQEGQKFQFSVNNAGKPVEQAVPYTIGLWQQTPPVEVTLSRGQNVLQFAVVDGSRGVTIKDFTLTPVK